MRGYNTLWQPGIDHAGIATQTVVERQLEREGKTRHDLGREKFIERVWEWKAESGGRIARAAARARRLGRLGALASSRWTPTWLARCTEAFVRLYEEGLIYRATRLINWCPSAAPRSAISRSRTKRAPTASCSSSRTRSTGSGRRDRRRHDAPRDDARRHRGRRASRRSALQAPPRQDAACTRSSIGKIPIITDAILVDPKFGTGAVKVTPAHDFNDFATGKRHGLEEINIFNLDGTMNENGGPFAGLDRKRARTRGEEGARRARASRAAPSRTCSRCRSASARAASSSR